MMRALLSHPTRFVSSGVALLILCSPAAAQSISYDGSLRYSQGKYTTDGTVTSSFWLNEFIYSTARWWAEVMVPVIYQDSAEVRYVGGMPMPVRGRGEGGGDHHGGRGGGPGGRPGEPGPSADFEELGLADPYLAVGTLVYQGAAERNSLGVFASLKAPVADERRGFGSGEWDFGLGVSWDRQAGRNLLFVEIAYWSLGEPPGVTFKEPVAFEVSCGRVLSDSRYVVETTVWGRTETVAGTDGPLALDVTLRRSLRNQQAVYVTAEAGFTESAPDFSLVVGYGARIWR